LFELHDSFYVAVDGMGNAWPAGKVPLPGSKKGPGPGQFKATEIIWAFFQRHEIPAIPVKNTSSPAGTQPKARPQKNK